MVCLQEEGCIFPVHAHRSPPPLWSLPLLKAFSTEISPGKAEGTAQPLTRQNLLLGKQAGIKAPHPGYAIITIQ
jgi:hypothetical protein